MRRQMKDVRRRLQQDLAVDEVAADREPTLGFGSEARVNLPFTLIAGVQEVSTSIPGKRSTSFTAAAN